MAANAPGEWAVLVAGKGHERRADPRRSQHPVLGPGRARSGAGGEAWSGGAWLRRRRRWPAPWSSGDAARALERRGARLAPASPATSCSSRCPARAPTATPSSPRRSRAAPRRRWWRAPSRRRRAPPLIRVDDTYAGLHALTRAVRAQVPRRLVGITGSTGKTTTKELLAACLARRFRVARTPGQSQQPVRLSAGAPRPARRLRVDGGRAGDVDAGRAAGDLAPGAPGRRALHQRAPGAPRVLRQPGGDRRGEGGAAGRPGAAGSGGRQRRRSAGGAHRPARTAAGWSGTAPPAPPTSRRATSRPRPAAAPAAASAARRRRAAGGRAAAARRLQRRERARRGGLRLGARRAAGGDRGGARRGVAGRDARRGGGAAGRRAADRRQLQLQPGRARAGAGGGGRRSRPAGAGRCSATCSSWDRRGPSFHRAAGRARRASWASRRWSGSGALARELAEAAGAAARAGSRPPPRPPPGRRASCGRGTWCWSRARAAWGSRWWSRRCAPAAEGAA